MHFRNNIKNSESSSSPKSHFYDSLLGISCFELKNKSLERGMGKSLNKKNAKATRPIAERTSESDEPSERSFDLLEGHGVKNLRPSSVFVHEEPQRSFILLQAHGIKAHGLNSGENTQNSFVVVKAHGVRSFSGRCITPPRSIDAVIQ